MTYVIAEPCIDVLDRACVDECPVDCIYEGERALYIHPDECVDCGACEPVCPVEAIFYEDDVPDEWIDWFREAVRPGTATIVVLVEDLDVAAFRAEVDRFAGAEILHTTLRAGALAELNRDSSVG